MIIAGLGIAAIGYAGKHLVRHMPSVTSRLKEALRSLPKIDGESAPNSKYYKGGFETKMSKREAALILGVSPNASKIRVGLRFGVLFFI